MMKKIALVVSGAALALSTATPALADPVMLYADLSGDGDGYGSFSGEIDAETGDVCYILAVSDLEGVTAAHIHAGAEGKNGKPVVTLQVTGEDEDLCVAAEPDTLKPIVAEPANFHVNVHTADMPKGAIRGQLAASEE